MDLSKFTDGIKLQNARIDYAIRSEGVSVIHERSYSYTVGMRSIGYPELLVRDLKPDESNERTCRLSNIFSGLFRKQSVA